MGSAVLLGEDVWMARRLARLGDEFGLRWEPADGVDAPVLVVIDLGGDDPADRVKEARGRWPQAIIAGYLAVPDASRWVAGQRAGCDVVANRGALVARLRPLLGAERTGTRRTFPLLDAADVAGRLGLVARVPDTPVGPVAVYHLDGAVRVVADRCPHAGATLSGGELDRAIVTCPRHGSQFDVRTGERMRGPADSNITTFPVVVADGQVSIIAGEV
jgi:nitrite reductase/ring-hydroxylating ferredoxin subunit